VVYRRAESKVENIIKQIEALNIRDFAGQNVTLYKQKCDQLLEELEVNLPVGQSVPTLRTKALKGLTHSTFPFFQGKVFEMSLQANLTLQHSTVTGWRQAGSS
jgi:hypothetical protein